MLVKKAILFISLFSLISCECPNGGLIWNGNCYIFNSTASGFAKAETACQKMNGHLTSIHDAFTNDILGQNAPDYFHQNLAKEFWISANSLLSSPNWEWTDGTEFDFHDWAKNEPSNESGYNCAVASTDNGLWRADDCFKLKPFICLIQSVTVSTTTPSITMNITSSTVVTTPVAITTTTPVTSQAGKCEKGWTFFGPTASCYGYFGDKTRSWQEGENYCQEFDAHLTSIHSDEENLFVLKNFVFPYRLLIGLFSHDSGVSWQWTDGTLLNYQPWLVSRHRHNGFNCVILSDYHTGENPSFFDVADCDISIVFKTTCKKHSF